MIKQYFKGTAVAIFVYDVCDKRSFKKIKERFKDFQKIIKEKEPNRKHKVLYYIIGSKCELEVGKGRKISYLSGH